MCPLCWATLLATFSYYLASLVVVVAGKDLWTLATAGTLVSLATAHQLQWTSVSWGVLALLAAAALSRCLWLVALRCNRTLVGKAWQKAASTAQARRPAQQRRESGDFV